VSLIIYWLILLLPHSYSSYFHYKIAILAIMNVRIPKGEDKKIIDCDDVYRIMQKVLLRQNKLRRKKEYFWTIGLNSASDLEYIELIALGGLNQVNIDPVEIFNFAVSKKCKRMILCHNHPSGNLKPSDSDIALTNKLRDGGELLHIDILDHLIIDEESYFSFKDKGFLKVG